MSQEPARKAISPGTVAAGLTAAVGATVVFAPAAEAATFEVTTLGDAGGGSLRQAILDANAAPTDDVITFASGLTGTITLATGQLKLTDDVEIDGPGAAALAISGNDASRVFYAYSQAQELDITISGLTIRDGQASTGAGVIVFNENVTLDAVRIVDNAATGNGGGLWADGFQMDLRIVDSVISGNTAGQDGGGGYVEDTGGLLTIESTTIADNGAGAKGGGVYFYDPDHEVRLDRTTITGNTAVGNGGGIYLYDTDGGPFVIDRSTISGNTSGGAGGGVYLYGPDQPVLIRNTTISANQAAEAGGVRIEDGAEHLTFTGATVAGNTTTGGPSTASNLRVRGSGSATLRGTVLADGAGGPDVVGSVSSENALIEDPSQATVTGTALSADPLLGSLADNGGPTQTMFPGPGSPLLDAGIDLGVAVDQRGLPRPAGAAADIGAVEVQPLTLTTASPATGAEGDSIVLTGTGFTGATGVRFGSTPAASFTVDSDTQITAVVPGGSGDVDVVVLRGSETSPVARFSYPAGPANPTPTPTPTPTPAPPEAPSPAPPAAAPRTLVCGRVPDLEGYTLTQVRRVLARDGCSRATLVFTRSELRRPTPRPGWKPKPFRRARVISQKPRAGTPVWRGEQISVVLRTPRS